MKLSKTRNSAIPSIHYHEGGNKIQLDNISLFNKNESLTHRNRKILVETSSFNQIKDEFSFRTNFASLTSSPNSFNNLNES